MEMDREPKIGIDRVGEKDEVTDCDRDRVSDCD